MIFPKYIENQMKGENMRCYKCDGVLSMKSSVCPKCGADVSIYKRAVVTSNGYYNLGLAKAKVRDLSGAVESLKASILINKRNIEARNLLGLVYCEMGDVVEALSQWVISKNLKPEDNIANSYIIEMQSNQNRFEMITSTIKKYNLSLRYAKEGNYDMAVIQLKKVVAQNPQLIKAHQLLALLYIKDKEYTRARKLLNAVLKIDKNNTLAQIYLKEITEELLLKKNDTSGNFLPKKKEKVMDEKPLSGNDVIMPRSSYKEPSNGAITIVNILVGVLIGAALVWFLILPAHNRGITEDYNKSIQQYSEQLSSGNVELESLTKQIEQIKAEKDILQQQLDQANASGGDGSPLNALVAAANAYLSNEKTAAAVALCNIDVSALPNDTAKELYNKISEVVMSSAAGELYTNATQEYKKADYEAAAKDFENAYKCDSTKVESAYYAAKSFDALGQTDNAKTYFQKIVDNFATSKYYSEAKTYIDTH